MVRAKVHSGRLLLPLFVLSVFALEKAEAQLATGYRPIQEPGIYGARVHASALAPNRRKWYLPQDLYYEYRWKGWEYSNYAREQYQRYVDILLEGERNYDIFGNYISRGFRIYDWTENQPQPQGSGIFKSPKFSGWFSRVIVSSAHKGQFFTSMTVGESIRTTMTPLTFSKPTFNGIQWDFLTDKYGLTLLSSRLNSPGNLANNESSPASRSENTTRLFGARAVSQLGDFAQMGGTWINVANTRTDLTFGENSLKGILTKPQNTGNVETVTIRISDDSPESPESGALLFFDRVIIDGEVHTEIKPIIRGGVRSGGNIEAKGADVLELIYDIRNDFRPTEKLPIFQEARKLEFELIIANDYKVEVASNMQVDRLGDEVFLPVAQARGEVTDGTNQRFLRFEYGLPTGHEVIGVDMEITDMAGLNVRAEYAVNRRFQRFPNQNFTKLAADQATAQAAYLTASYINYPWFAYGEAFTMEPDYSTTSFISNSLGGVDYGDEQRNLFEFVDDNDDQDRFADWFRAGQLGTGIGVSGGSAGGDTEVFPGLDENNDFVSDFNQNQNSRPDYSEPFLRYAVDPPEFLFGMDMNNNTLIDRFEDDRLPDYPYERDHAGYNLYGGLRLTEQIQLTAGRLREELLSRDRSSEVNYGLITADWRLPGMDISVFEHFKFVKDNIPEDRIRWIDPIGLTDFPDPLDNQDTFVNSLFLRGRYHRIRNLNVAAKLKYEIFSQRGDQTDIRRDRSFVGLINKADYTLRLNDSFTLFPKWKSTFRSETPSDRALQDTKSLEQTLFLVTRYTVIPGTTWLAFGTEFSNFDNLKKKSEQAQVGVVEDFRSLVFSILFSNTSAYLGYKLTMNTGFQWERQSFEEATRKETLTFVRIFASTGTD